MSQSPEDIPLSEVTVALLLEANLYYTQSVWKQSVPVFSKKLSLSSQHLGFIQRNGLNPTWVPKDSTKSENLEENSTGG